MEIWLKCGRNACRKETKNIRQMRCLRQELVIRSVFPAAVSFAFPPYVTDKHISTLLHHLPLPTYVLLPSYHSV